MGEIKKKREKGFKKHYKQGVHNVLLWEDSQCILDCESSIYFRVLLINSNNSIGRICNNIIIVIVI